MQSPTPRTILRVVLGLSLSLLVTGAPTGTGHVADAAASANITIDAGSSRGTIPPTAFGMNTAVWDGHLLDGSMPSLMRQAGVSVLRFPGGSSADNYHWQTNSFCNGGYANPNNTFDSFMSVARATGAQPLITVNYGSNTTCNGGGDPAEAAGWVRYANVTKGYGVKYWEIGNEVYGNGTYPGGWETDLHAAKGPAAYASNTSAFVDAMKASDPSIKVGIAVTTPGYWPDGRSPAWNSNTLAAVCSKIDFVDVHWYPINDAGTDADLLASTGGIAGMMATLRAEINAACGAHADHVQILLGEMNTNSTGKQRVSLVDALFLADGFMTWLEDGAANASWWDLHNGIDLTGNNSPSLYGTATYGDLGVLSSGASVGGMSEPPANTPFPPYYGLQMLTKLGAPGDTMVAAASDQALVAAHAVRQANGSLALLLINKSPDTTYNVAVSLSGYSPASAATIYAYGMQGGAIATTSSFGIGNAFTQSVPPYSLTTVIMTPSTTSPLVLPSPTAPVLALPSPTAPVLALPSPTAPVLAPPTAAPAMTSPPTAGPLAVTISASSASATSVTPGGTTILAATVAANIPLSGTIVDFYVYDASGHLVAQTWQSPVALAAGASQTAKAAWSVPATLAPGTYTLKVGVFGAGWSPLYAWDDAASTFTVGTSVPSNTATSVPSNTATSAPSNTATSVPSNTATSVPSNTATSIPSNTATSAPSNTATSAPSNTATSAPSNTATSAPSNTATSAPSNTATSAPSATSPLVLPPPTAPVLALPSPTAPVLAPPTAAPAMTSPPTAGPLAVTISASSASATSVTPGGTTILAATVAANIPLSGTIVDFYVYDASGHLVAQTWQSPVALAAGASQTAKAAWSVPATLPPGTYTLKVGVFGAGWSPLYAWDDAASTFTVGVATFALPFNDTGISSDANPNAANFDGYGDSYSAQTLQSAGLTSGQQVIAPGMTFRWPNVTPGAPNDIVAHGQTLHLATPVVGTTLAFLGAASNGPTTGTGIVTYADGSTRRFTLGFSDWTLNGGALTLGYGNSIAATLPYRNHGASHERVKTFVFRATVPLQEGKVVTSVTLPATVTHGQLHIFALAMSTTAQP